MKYITFLVLILVEIQLGSLRNPFWASKDTTNDCLVYEKINGTIKKSDYGQCIVGNHCCFSALSIDQSGEFVTEAGGCENDFESFIHQHSGIRVHPLDRLPFLGQFSNEKMAEYCEFEMCIASAIPNNHWRICACHEDRCNQDGINEMLRKYMAVKPSETSTLSLNVFNRDIEIIMAG